MIRADLSGPVYYLLLGYLVLAPLQRGLFFEPDLFPNLLALAVLFALHALGTLARGRPWLLRIGLAEAGLGLMVAAYAAAFFPAADRRAALVGFLEVLAGALVYALVAALAGSPARRQALLHAVWLCGVFASAFAVAAAAGLVDFPGAVVGSRLASLLQYPNALAGLLIGSSLAGVGLWTARRAGAAAQLYACGTYLCQLALLGSQSRAGWLVYPLAFAVLLAMLPPAWRWWATYAQAAALGAAMLAGTRALPALLAGHARTAALALLAGALALAAVQAVAAALPALLRRYRPAELTLRLLRYGGVVYVALIAVAYVAYASRVPAGLATVVPAPVLTRAETIQPGAAAERGRYARDALRLIAERPWLGAGAGGWDALYHRVQTSLYWTTEVHSHPLQVAVEAGLPGLLGFALAVAGVARAAWAARDPEAAHPAAVLDAAAAAAAAGLLAHASIDFDFSLPGLAFAFWALAGAVRAAGPPPEGPPLPAGRAVAWALAGLAAAGALAYPAWRLNEARLAGSEAGAAFQQGRLGLARERYERALALDPWRGAYAVDLAQVHLARYLAGFDAKGLAKARAALEHALRVQPWSLPVRSHAVRLYGLMGDRERALEAAAGLVRAAPLDARGYGLYGSLLAGAAFERLEARDVAAAREYLARLLRLERHWQAQLRRAAEASRPRLPHVPDDPYWRLARGQAYLLAGYPERAEVLLRGVGGEAQAQARAWRAAALYLLGRPRDAVAVLETGPGDVEEARQLFTRLLALHGFPVDPRTLR